MRVPHEFMCHDFIVVIGSLSSKCLGGYLRDEYKILHRIMRCGFAGDIRLVDVDVPMCLVAFSYPAWFPPDNCHRMGSRYMWVASEDLRVVGSLDGAIARFKAANSQKTFTAL